MQADATTAELGRGRTDRPLLFISHRHTDQSIADELRKFVVDRSGGRIDVFQSSSAQAENPRVGRELQQELKEHLWAAEVVILVYTSPEEDWSYCMWECGVATLQTPETRIVVFQCGRHTPAVYGDAVRVNALELNGIQQFTSDFLTDPDFFPGHAEAVAPGFSAAGEEVQAAARQLHGALDLLIGQSAEEGQDWATVPFLRLQLSYVEVDSIRQLGQEEGARAVLEAARVVEIDAEAMRLFGLGRVEQQSLFRLLVDTWKSGRPDTPTLWIDELTEQLREGSHWRRLRFRWQLFSSVDQADTAKYAPVLSRVRSVPRRRCHEFDVYFNKFETAEGAVRIGFVDEPQTAPGEIPAHVSGVG